MRVFFTIGYLWNLKFAFDGNTFFHPYPGFWEVFEYISKMVVRVYIYTTFSIDDFHKMTKMRQRIMQDLERENVCVYKIEVWLFIYKLTMCMAKIICKDAVHYTDWKNVKDF